MLNPKTVGLPMFDEDGDLKHTRTKPEDVFVREAFTSAERRQFETLNRECRTEVE